MADTYNPFGVALAFQRDAMRVGKRTAEQGLDAQRSMTEAFVRNAVGMGRAANRGGLEATRQGMRTYAGMLDVAFPGMGESTTTSIDSGIDSVLASQEVTWRAVEEGVENGLAVYSQLARAQRDVFVESTQSMLGVQERVAAEATDASVEYERQRPEDHGTRGEKGDEAERGTATADTPSETEPQEVEPGEIEEAPETVTTSPESEPAAEPEVETDREEPSEPGQLEVELEELSGVGRAYAQRLRDAGIEHVGDLYDADVADLSDATEISDERIENWQKQARHMQEDGG